MLLQKMLWSNLLSSEGFARCFFVVFEAAVAFFWGSLFVFQHKDISYLESQAWNGKLVQGTVNEEHR